MFGSVLSRSMLLGSVLLFVASMASAQIDEQYYNDPCAGTMDPDTCFWSPMVPSAGGGGGYAACTAVGSAGQRCQAAVQDLYPPNGKFCASVERSAYCECNKTTFKVDGICTYYK